MLAPLGFNNTFAMLVRRETAENLGIRTLSEAVPYASGWQAGFGYEFLEREDGFQGLARHYGLQLAVPPRVMDLGLSYRHAIYQPFAQAVPNTFVVDEKSCIHCYKW